MFDNFFNSPRILLISDVNMKRNYSGTDFANSNGNKLNKINKFNHSVDNF